MAESRSTSSAPSAATPAGGPPAPVAVPPGLRADIERAGYYPDLVADAVASALDGEPVVSHLVHQETTFDTDEVRRHVTVLVLTPTRMVVGHTDDHVERPADGAAAPPASRPAASATPVATTSSETVPLARVHSVVVTRVVADPARYVSGSLPQEVTLTIGWGAVARVELEPASCGDPGCDADHGYSGTTSSDDLSLRLSREAEGADAVEQALAFAAALARATSRAAVDPRLLA